MNAAQGQWSRRYREALLNHIGRGREAVSGQALQLGRRAVNLGLDALEVARIHHAAVSAIPSPKVPRGHAGFAEAFFAETLLPMESAPRPPFKAKGRLAALQKVLGRRTAELARSDRHLQRGIQRREGAEKALNDSAKHYDKLLKESRDLQDHLRRLNRRLLLAQEQRQEQTSRKLHDEIAQTLVAISVRLFSLGHRAAGSAGNLDKEIARMRGVVRKSLQSIERFGRDHVQKQKA
jgi:signal transduction histidine kinase